MQILVTGAAGFLGTLAVRHALAGPPGWPAVTRVIAVDLQPCAVRDDRLDVRVGSLTDPAFVRSIVGPELQSVLHLAAVVSGQAEAEFDLGFAVNVDGTRALLEACRGTGARPRLVFASTVAVFGGRLPAVVADAQAAWPQSSYGAAKAIGEILVTEYSRRGWIDGISCRLPTVAVRPGAPNSAVSSFVSGIVREPLAGVDAICPVALDTPLWISSPAAATANLLHAVTVDTSRLADHRTVNLPGLSTTPREMLDALERVAGPAIRARVRVVPDPALARVVSSWPGRFDTRQAQELGFTADRDVDAVLAQAMPTR